MPAKGLNTVMKNLKKELAVIENKTVASLIKAAILIQRDMENTPPLTPVDYGNLRSSFFIAAKGSLIPPGAYVGPHAQEIGAFSTRTVLNYSAKAGKSSKGKYSVFFGFSAYYAMKVHERVGAKFKRPGAGPFFFEASVKRNTPLILDMVREEARIE